MHWSIPVFRGWNTGTAYWVYLSSLKSEEASLYFKGHFPSDVTQQRREPAEISRATRWDETKDRATRGTDKRSDLLNQRKASI